MNNIQNKKPSTWVALSLVPLVALALSACGSDNNSSSSSAQSAKVACATGTVNGAGSTFVQNLAQQWIKDYQAACPGSTINYQGVGSGAGIQQLTAGTVNFAGSDVQFTSAEKTAANAKYGNVLQIPWASGGVAVEYKLSGITNLKLSSTTLASIFAGKITKWNDPAIAADNSGTTLPSTAIQVVHRSDGSGTTAAFTGYLTATAPNVWTTGAAKDVPWPTGQGAKGSDGVTAAVKSTDGAIGYAEVSFAKANSLSVVSIKNEAGQFVSPETDGAVTAALNQAQVNHDAAANTIDVTMNYKATDPKAYPISTFTFVMVPQNPANAGQAKLLKSFINYALTTGQNAAPGLDFAPLPSSITTAAQAVVSSIGSATSASSTTTTTK